MKSALLVLLCLVPAVRGQDPSALDADRAEDRAAAERALRNLTPEALDPSLFAKAMSLSPEGRRRFVLALGDNAALLTPLVEALRGGGPTLPLVRDCLRAHARAQALPPPPRPGSIEVLPEIPLALSGLRDLVDLSERLLVGDLIELPLLIDPRLDQDGTMARRELNLPPGAFFARQLLQLPGLAVRLRPGGILVTVPAGPRDLDELCALSIEALVGPDERIARRAAQVLGASGIPTFGPWLEALAATESRAVPGLATAFLRGFEPEDPGRAGGLLLAAFRDRPSERLVLGHALRELFVRAPAPAWYAEPMTELGAHEEDWTWFAPVAPARLGPMLRSLLAEVLPANPSVRRRGVLACFARSSQVLDAELATALADRIRGGGFPDDSEGNPELAEALLALERAGRSIDDPGDALGNSFGRGLLWGRHLPAPARLRVLARSAGPGPAQFALCLAPRRQPFGSWDLLEVPAEGRRFAGAGLSADQATLLDLCFPGLEAPQGIGRGRWERVYACFDRLSQALDGGWAKGIQGRDRALAEALAALLLALPRGPGDRPPAEWIGDWVASEDSREVGLLVGSRCLRERGHWLPAIGDVLTRKLDSLSAVMLRGRLLEGTRGRPREFGRAPVDPGDPLLDWPRTPGR